MIIPTFMILYIIYMLLTCLNSDSLLCRTVALHYLTFGTSTYSITYRRYYILHWIAGFQSMSCSCHLLAFCILKKQFCSRTRLVHVSSCYFNFFLFYVHTPTVCVNKCVLLPFWSCQYVNHKNTAGVIFNI